MWRARVMTPSIVKELRKGTVSNRTGQSNLGHGGDENAFEGMRGGQRQTGSFVEKLREGGSLSRTMLVISYVSAAMGTFGILVGDSFQTMHEEHCFSELERFLLQKRDAFFGVETPEFLLKKPSPLKLALGKVDKEDEMDDQKVSMFRPH